MKKIFVLCSIIVLLCFPAIGNAANVDSSSVYFQGHSYKFEKDLGGSIYYKIDNENSISIRSEVLKSPWSDKNIDPKADGSISAVAMNDKIYLFFRGRGSKKIYYVTYDGNNWEKDVNVGIASGGKIDPWSDQGVGAVLYKNKIYVAYKGYSSKQLYFFTYDGISWGNDTSIKNASGGKIDPWISGTPTLFVDKTNILNIEYRGYKSKNIYYTVFDGETWGGDIRR